LSYLNYTHRPESLKVHHHYDRLSSSRHRPLNQSTRGVRRNAGRVSGGALGWRLSVKHERKTPYTTLTFALKDYGKLREDCMGNWSPDRDLNPDKNQEFYPTYGEDGFYPGDYLVLKEHSVPHSLLVCY